MSQASRRQFFQFLASSPLLALAYPALAADWRQAIDLESRHRAAHGALPPRTLCPECGAEMAFQQGSAPVMPGATALDDQFGGQMVESAGEAINVWDFEKVAHANNLPVHWAYLHMGVDDLETRVANREGYQRLQLRPRRIGPDAAKLDTTVTLFGRKWDTPLFLCPVAALEAYHTEGESGAGPGGARRRASCRSSRTRARSRTSRSSRRGASRTGSSSTRTRTGASRSARSRRWRRPAARRWSGPSTCWAAATAS